MKLEIEINDADINKYIQRSFDNITSGYVNVNMQSFLNERVKEGLEKAFKETDFSELIQEKCIEVATAKIEEAAQKKVPGWIAQQMKEMLKYASATFWDKKTNETA